ncbi:MAG: dephospho-CoA kinase, partial [Gemmatimonadales bacterium]
MLHIALTGNVAAGKSTVGRLFQSWGATLIDADQLVREAQSPG